MKLVRISNWSPKPESIKDKNADERFFKDLNTDLKNVMLFSEGRVRFGDSVDGNKGENISGEFQIFTSVLTATAENIIAHGLGVVPTGYLVINQGYSGSLYSSGTSWTSGNVYLRSSTTGTNYTIFLLK